MRLATLGKIGLCERLQGPGLFLRTGPFTNRIQTRIAAVVDGVLQLYADYPVCQDESFADFHVALTQPVGPRRWYRPQVRFEFDRTMPFKPLPLAQSLPALEWGLNWCVGNHAHTFLVIHAAAIEKGGCAAILPGPPGSGKSTLTAYLVHKGWRLLSDELALISLQDGQVTPLARPVSLKNRSIDVIAETLPDAVLSARCKDTVKGTVSLLKAPRESVERVAEPALPAWVIFPSFKVDATANLMPCSKAVTLIELGRNAFNYSIHGKAGFEVLAGLVDRCACYSFSYSRLPDAIPVFDSLLPSRQEATGTPA